jgi:phosphohistidine phosphatase SixA
MKKTFLVFALGIHILTSFNLVKIEASEKKEHDGSMLIQSLRKGGYLLYFRHGETIGQDQPNVDYHDCNTQKNLTLFGNEQAERIGELFERNGIPTNYPVLASPYCRARQTAENAFGKQKVAVVPFLSNIEYLRSDKITKQEEKAILQKINELFEKPIRQGTNTIIVGHTFSPNKVLGEILYMGVVVIKPNGIGGGYDIVKKLSYDELIRQSRNERLYA